MAQIQDIPMDIVDEATKRNKEIIKTSIIGVVANVILAAFKAVVGLVTNSIAVTLDAVNNLSDALASIITIVATVLSGKLPDKKHPLGYGRIEYLSGMIVAALVLYAGITAGVESVKKIIHPEAADYSMISLVIIAAAVVVKFVMGRLIAAKGKELNSSSLIATGADASFDSVLSLSVLISAIIFIKFHISLEAYVGVVIAIIIIKSGFEMMRDTVDEILGQRAEKDMVAKIKSLINEEEEVRGAYDLFINNYGPNKNYASIHIELPDTMTVDEVDVLTRRLQAKVYTETGVILTGVGVYSYNTSNEEVAHMRNDISHIVMNHEWAIQMHGFYVDMESKAIRFDVVFSFAINPDEGVEILTREIGEKYEGYMIHISPDIDIAD
ncbi:MAG: cation diffusion facilitator family transporter [Lachnospiraceae bacterium]|nr:cation diffusion facilitator family transporter [Lachnospiraceae bacterium]